MMLVEYVSMRFLSRRGRRIILDKLNPRLESGKNVGVAGPNGARKTTLVRRFGLGASG